MMTASRKGWKFTVEYLAASASVISYRKGSRAGWCGLESKGRQSSAKWMPGEKPWRKWRSEPGHRLRMESQQEKKVRINRKGTYCSTKGHCGGGIRGKPWTREPES